MTWGYLTKPTRSQQSVLDRKLGYDDGGRFALLAVSGYEISKETDAFGTIFSIIDCSTGDETEQSKLTSPTEVSAERRHMMARVMHLNGREDPYA